MALTDISKPNAELTEQIIEWDVPNWSKALDFWQPYITELKNRGDVKVLSIGERNGGITLWLALQGFKVVCTDYEGITEKAREIHRKYNVSDLITYESLNIFEGKYPDSTFDLVICKSVLGGLKKVYSDRKTRTFDAQKDAVTEVYRMLKKDGYLLGAENMKGSFIHHFIRKQMGRIKGWRPFTVPEIREMLSAFSEYSLRFYGFLGVSGNSSMMNAMSRLLNTVVSPVIPESARYICFFAAKK